MPIGFLQRATLRKVATDSGFDVLHDVQNAVVGRSSHAPLSCVMGSADDGRWLLGLSMPSVFDALSSPVIGPGLTALPAASNGWSASGDVPTMPRWLLCSDLSVLDAVLGRAWMLSRTLPNALERRFENALAAVGDTEREATVRQRVGQNLFREGLMVLWGGRCAISGLDVPELLRASHAKPWADSTDVERLDVYNGLLLAAHLDAAFDSGLISVSPSGDVLVSTALPAHARLQLGLAAPAMAAISRQHQPYLHWHREYVFQQRCAAA